MAEVNEFWSAELHVMCTRDGPKFGERRSSAECSARFGSAT